MQAPRTTLTTCSGRIPQRTMNKRENNRKNLHIVHFLKIFEQRSCQLSEFFYGFGKQNFQTAAIQ